MQKPIGFTAVFAGTLGAFGLVLYLIFGIWLPSARHTDHLFDQQTRLNEKSHIATVIAIPKITDVGSVRVSETIVTYKDFNNNDQKITSSQTGNNVVLMYGINVFKDGHTELGSGLPGSYHFFPPLLLGIMLSVFGGVGLLAFGASVLDGWAGYYNFVEDQERREREDHEAAARKLAREAELSPMQRDAQARIQDAEALPDTVADKSDLVRRARAVAEALDKPDTGQAGQLRAELDALERTLSQS